MRGYFPQLFTNTLGEIETTIRGETSKAIVDTGATISGLYPTLIHCPLPWSIRSIQIVGVSNLPLQILKSESLTFQLGTITGKLVFLLVKCAPIHLIGRDLSEASNAHIAFSQKGEMLLGLEILMLSKI